MVRYVQYKYKEAYLLSFFLNYFSRKFREGWCWLSKVEYYFFQWVKLYSRLTTQLKSIADHVCSVYLTAAYIVKQSSYHFIFCMMGCHPFNCEMKIGGLHSWEIRWPCIILAQVHFHHWNWPSGMASITELGKNSDWSSVLLFSRWGSNPKLS